MANGPDWGKHGAIAAWVGVAVAIVLVVVQEVWPPDPAHPMSLDFLSKSIIVPPWLVILALLTTMTFTAVVVRRITKATLPPPPLLQHPAPQKLPDVTKLFDVHPTSLDARASSPTIFYPAKLRLSLENKSGEVLRVLAPRWITTVGNVSVQCGAAPFPGVPYAPAMMEFGYRYQFEEYVGSWKLDKWKQSPSGQPDEHPEINVDPGWTFRIWIGLNPCVPHKDLEDRRKTHRLGTLVLPLIVGNQKSEWVAEV